MRPRTLPSRRPTQEGERGARRRRGVLGAFFFLVLFVFIWRVCVLKPRAITCRTTENTRCPDSIEQALKPLQQTRWWDLPQEMESLERRVQESEPDLQHMEWHRTLTLQLQVKIERATPLFAVLWENQWWLLRSNGTLTATDLIPPVSMNLPADSVHNHLIGDEWRHDDRLLALQFLFTETSRSRPSLKRIELISPQEIRAQTDSSDTVLLQATSVQEMQRQLDTLQALFRSSTMETETTGRTIDVRFRDVIVK